MSEIISEVKVYDAVVAERHGPAEGPMAEITYDVMAVNTPDNVRLRNATPWRAWRDVRILAAEQYHPCKIVKVRDKLYLYMATEQVKTREACP